MIGPGAGPCSVFREPDGGTRYARCLPFIPPDGTADGAHAVINFFSLQKAGFARGAVLFTRGLCPRRSAIPQDASSSARDRTRPPAMAPYFLTNLIPRRETRQEGRPLLSVLAGLSFLQWAHYWTGYLAWTCDAIDFFAVSLSVSGLQESFGINNAAKIVSALSSPSPLSSSSR
jgi:hypothetical protein